MRAAEDRFQGAAQIVDAWRAAGEEVPSDVGGLILQGLRLLREMETWTVYCFAVPTGQRKIGVTAGRCKSRLSELQTGNHQTITMDFAIAVTAEAARQIEGLAHRRLRGERLEGEWFDCQSHQAREVVEGCYQRYLAAWWTAYCTNVGIIGANPTVPRYLA